jgi:glutaryl-CoA dehydrogenase
MSDISFERPDPRDFLDIDSLLSEEEIMLRDAVRTYVQKEIVPNVGDWWDEGVLPQEALAKAFGDIGLLGMHLQGYGCAGTSATAYGLACLELEAGDSGIRSFVSVQGSLVMFPIWKFGSEEQKQTWLPRMASGEVIGCFGLTEPDSGSDPQGRERLARQRDQDVDHQWVHCRPGRGLGPHGRWCPRVSDPDRHPRFLGARDQEEGVTAGIGHLGVDPRRCQSA